MKNSLKIINLLAALCLLAGSIYAGASQDQAEMAGMKAPAMHDPKKKKAGESCKSSDECQKHHSCDKIGAKSVCTAPEPLNIPNT